MKFNNKLRIHMINVGHGDSILIEFPDLQIDQHRKPRFGLLDAGGMTKPTRKKTLDYVNKFIQYRLQRNPSIEKDAEDFIFEFICLSHPHLDHLNGMLEVLEGFCTKPIPPKQRPRQFWDCGFRYNTVSYLKILAYLINHPEVQFIRVTSGTEFYFNEVEVMVLAPSIDMRNRYDTYGVDLNDASIILRISFGKGVVVLTGDAHFETWGKVCEEFPRKKHLTYPPVTKGGRTKADMRDPNHPDIVFTSKENQLDCHLLKVAHHGSKRGTSYEYIEKLGPSHFAITCDSDKWYKERRKTWVGKFPHPITRLIIGEETKKYDVKADKIPGINDLGKKIGSSIKNGTMIYTIDKKATIKRTDLGEKRDTLVKVSALDSKL